MLVDDKKAEEISTQPVGAPSVAAVENFDQESIEKQTRTRRLFSTAQLFAFSLVYLQTWFAVGGNLFFPLQNGGPETWLFSYLLVAVGVLCQAASFAELASIQPIAGAQYYWTYHFAPPRAKLFLTWIQGWTTWLGFVSMMASLLNYQSLLLEGVYGFGQPSYEQAGWHTTVTVVAILAFCVIINCYTFRVVPWLELLSGTFNIVLFLVVLVTLWVMAPRNSPDVFLTKSNAGGWDDFISFNIGTLGNISLFVAFEGAVHMGEETRKARKAVPRAIFWSMAANVALGLIMLFTFGIAMPPAEELLSTISPVVAVLQHATGSTAATIAIMAGTMVPGIASSIGMVSSAPRLTWAWARDGGLPKYFTLVDARTRVPIRAVYGTVVIVVLLALLNLNDEAYIAHGAITSLSCLAMYVSYTIVLGCVVYARYASPTGIRFGPWNLGRFGPVVNGVALVYTVYEIIWLPFPNVLPVTARNMNYSGPVYLLVGIGAITWWFAWARKHWRGPNLAVVDIVLRNDGSTSKD